MDKSRGAAIGYLALSATQRNLLNDNDEGRFIQQSYYGDKDGSMWAKQPWSNNPVQGGSYKGEDAKTLDFKKTASGIYAKVEPLHWANAKPCPEAIMQEWITLDGPIAKVRMRLDYSGPTHKRKAHQEMPAMFVDYDLPNLVFEKDGKLVRRVPGDLSKDSMQDVSYDTQWMAYVDDRNFGIAFSQAYSNQLCSPTRAGHQALRQQIPTRPPWSQQFNLCGNAQATRSIDRRNPGSPLKQRPCEKHHPHFHLGRRRRHLHRSKRHRWPKHARLAQQPEIPGSGTHADLALCIQRAGQAPR